MTTSFQQAHELMSSNMHRAIKFDELCDTKMAIHHYELALDALNQMLQLRTDPEYDTKYKDYRPIFEKRIECLKNRPKKDWCVALGRREVMPAYSMYRPGED